MWNNNGNNGYQQDSTNTHIQTLFGPLSYLQIGCWDDKISLDWVPMKGVTEAGRVVYDKDQKIRTALTHDKVEALVANYTTLMRDKIMRGEDPGPDGISVGVTVMSGGRDNTPKIERAVVIEYKRDGNGGYATFLSLTKDMTPKTPPIVTYQFNSTKVVAGSSPEMGELKEGTREGELMWFMKLLELHGSINRYMAHANKMAEKFSSRNNNSGGNGYQNSNGYNGGGSPQMPSDTGFMNIPDGIPDSGVADFSAFE